MKIVIQCAGSKNDNACYMKTSNRKCIKFIGNPNLLQENASFTYYKPDDKTDDNLTWRDKLLEYNKKYKETGDNKLDLLPAYKLYKNKVYQELVKEFRVENIFILSAGWGLVRGDFLLPNYDITFSSVKEKYKMRNYKKDVDYNDFCQLPLDSEDDLIYLGGKNYQDQFIDLTKNYKGKRIVYYNSKDKPILENCEITKFKTNAKTTWYYGLAKELINN